MKTDFVLDGQQLGKASKALKPTVERIADILEAIPYKQLVTTPELSVKVGITYSRIRGNYTSDPRLSSNRLLVQLAGATNRQLVWGSKRTINALKKRMAL